MSSETSPAAGDGWTYITSGSQRIPVHCGGQALDLDLGEWECRACDTTVHVREITGWRAPSGDRAGYPGS
ncbi:hypothetical protein [Kitasatospora indigofera]|uniref:hypothetical protein n=1 Tax=Kitasatospora indigofera TaxID=67307 RepID=UPI0036C17C22